MFNQVSVEKKYLRLLKKDIQEISLNIKKRTRLINVNLFHELSKMISNDEKISIDGKSMTKEEAIKSCIAIHHNLVKASNPLFYHKYILSYIDNARKNHDEKSIAESYNQTVKELNAYRVELYNDLYFCNRVMKTMKNELKNIRKEEYNNMKLNKNQEIQKIYKECAEQGLTLDEREKRIAEVKSENFFEPISESYSERGVELSNKEKLGFIKTTLYERAATGEISVSQREKLLQAAKDKYAPEIKKDSTQIVKKEECGDMDVPDDSENNDVPTMY